jgi:hypothetical protein
LRKQLAELHSENINNETYSNKYINNIIEENALLNNQIKINKLNN